MIKFKNTEAKLAEYVEMAVKFGSKVKNENFEDYASFEHAIRETRNGDAMIKSSSNVNYDNQEQAWRAFAEAYSYDGIKDLANSIAKLMGTDDNDFKGMEGLAAISGNKVLMDRCDYNCQKGDQLVVSLMYGGGRLKQWKRYAKPYITPGIFIENLSESNDFDSLGIEFDMKKLSNNSFSITFREEQRYLGNHPQDPVGGQGGDAAKKAFQEILENADELFDFNIAENFESNTWTITVK